MKNIYKIGIIIAISLLMVMQLSAFADDAPGVNSPFGNIEDDNTTQEEEGKTPPEQPPVDTAEEEDGKTPPEQPPVDTTEELTTNNGGNGGGGSLNSQEETGNTDGAIGNGSQTGSDKKTHPAASDASVISKTGPAAGILIIPSLITGIVVKRRKKEYNKTI